MLCRISHCTPQDPVISKVCGCLFERRLIEKYIDDNGRCPVTGETLGKDDLLSVRCGDSRATVAASNGIGPASIPGLLDRLYAEWDGLMLEQFSLRQQLSQCQQELSHALLQYEAACHVIATLTSECDELRGAKKVKRGADNEEHEGVLPLPETVLDAMATCETEERKNRKQRKGSAPDVVPCDDVQSFVEKHTFSITGGSALCLAHAGGYVFAAGTGQHDIVQYSLKQSAVVAHGLGHTSTVHAITTAGEDPYIISASDDATVRIWQPQADALSCTHTLRYSEPLSGLSHQLLARQYILVSGQRSSLYISNVERGEQVGVYDAAQSGLDGQVVNIELHPYGSLAAIGTSAGTLVMWDVRGMCADTVITLPRTSSDCYVHSTSFHTDCFSLTTGLSTGDVLIWDLRKFDEPTATLSPPGASGTPSVVSCESEGAYLAVASEELLLYSWPQLSQASPATSLWTTSGRGSPCASVCWGPCASWIGLGHMDGAVTLHGSA